MDDLLAMQRCNLWCLPENYALKVCYKADADSPPQDGGRC